MNSVYLWQEGNLGSTESYVVKSVFFEVYFEIAGKTIYIGKIFQ